MPLKTLGSIGPRAVGERVKHLQIRAQATLASGIGCLDLIPRLHNMKNENEDEDNFFGSN
jgi:hypothetical protein